MNWYYVENGKQNGPVNDEQFNEMSSRGQITPDTLVWHEGMPDWLPSREIKGGGLSATAPPGQVVCSECGKSFPVDETISYGNAHVCAACKPQFLQKLQEGAALATGELNYAHLGIRIGAYLLDFVILFAVGIILRLAMGLSLLETRNAPGVALGVSLFVSAAQLIIGMTYEVVLVAKYGATLGKMACKIKVVTAEGGRVSYARAFGRYFSKILSGLICCIGYLIAVFDRPQRRALHDHICNTRVIQM